ncbi:putative cyclase [Clostridiales bacterium 1_7_47FAA]|uniref:Cyclase family protein n=1 Tax=Enterocloster hominis (ex Hitch et al. 2024) TaxID=1917870 RepID=A0ABV1DAI7_9FIRM|nr:cyclase family protein [Lachnoclostridium pacaense]EEQ60080.1 putative cyclase [Clostridiales bacterium 1_7_47FAA]
MYQLLSYPIKQKQPAWPGNPTFSLEPYNSISSGDIANTCTIHLFNHYGTHLDGPMHFYDKGVSLDKLPMERFFYHNPLLIDIPKKPGEKIIPEDIIPYERELKKADLLLIRTGFWKYRLDQPETYEQNGPAISSSTARYFQDNHLHLKAVALDFISLASYSDTLDGDLAHQIMLGMYHDNFICIIEDVNMKGLPSGFMKKTAAVPLIIEGIDSSPITMWAEY